MPMSGMQEGKHTRGWPQPLGALSKPTNPSTHCGWNFSYYGTGRLELSKSGLLTGWSEPVAKPSGASGSGDKDVWAVGLRLVRSG